ncbi:hypothetical protein G7K_1958-t1 [Saitoella complicata NRRL Y-17804]|uniref:Uncharacterized protein n=1 Tax=Saitoella complicata (strain BCRC 22490 / CBS 7301 / JCM 7358 / NBRC 10748 / NRRL Y-17804) TaxID=698492 RepID=A0A0E9ND44_SAICN|nr:hypothetical protein G7K_1958-t1 [Saitoella complicata NRRL Y-17804]
MSSSDLFGGSKNPSIGVISKYSFHSTHFPSSLDVNTPITGMSTFLFLTGNLSNLSTNTVFSSSLFPAPIYKISYDRSMMDAIHTASFSIA